ncbi:MAG: primosomal protein DnaI [bacterium]|nr:primosomal protein DnaI [bacterium]
MDKIDNIVGNVLKINKSNLVLRLEKSFDEACENDNFKKVVKRIKLPKKELMKYTTKLEKTTIELNNCKNCKNVIECKNEVEGCVYYPEVNGDQLIFNYVTCKKKQELDKKLMYQDNISCFCMPKEIKNASMKDILVDDKARFETIKWLKKFIDDYSNNLPTKGLFLTGNFGCGKTYLISAMMNELAKKGHRVVIIYYPEFLRSLKASFSNNDDNFDYKFNYIKKSELLLIDDIGADSVTEWSRDEVLGTLLQYRMQEKLVTFFTSNLNLKQLEEHLSFSNKGIDKIKARRIIERIKQLSTELVMIGENKRK